MLLVHHRPDASDSLRRSRAVRCGMASSVVPSRDRQGAVVAAPLPGGRGSVGNPAVNRSSGATLTRSGFTLVELLVVISIIAFLAALTVAFYPSINSQTSEAQGAANFQGWLNLARQKAIRNQNPFGVRLWIQNATDNTQANFMQVVECSYIEQPDDFVGGTLTSSTASSPPTVTIAGVDVTGGFAPDTTLYPVQPGDYLEVLGNGLMHSIAQPSAANGGAPVVYDPKSNTSTLFLTTAIPYAVNNTSSYRILRAPRPVGEEKLPLPSGVVIDLNTNTTFSNALPGTALTAATGTTPGTACVDVLFGPAGSVITSQLAQNTMNFWVRSPDPNNPSNVFAGSPTLIVVYAKTGLVAAVTPAQSASGPYIDIQ